MTGFSKVVPQLSKPRWYQAVINVLRYTELSVTPSLPYSVAVLCIRDHGGLSNNIAWGGHITLS